MLSYSDFLEKLTDCVCEKLGSSYTVSVVPVRKNNSVCLDSMTILKSGSNISPAIYLQAFYNFYLKCKSIDETAEELLNFYFRAMPEKPVDMSFCSDLSIVGDNIVFRLINFEKNRDLLEDCPHWHFLDLALVCYCLVSSEQLGKGAILIRKEHMQLWGLTLDDLLKAAMKNTRRLLPSIFLPVDDMLESLDVDWSEEPYPEHPLDESGQPFPLYVLTNNSKFYGAYWMTDQPLLSRIGQQLDSDFYVLPSSVHECMVVPKSTAAELGDLRHLVHEVNTTQLEPEEYLSDTVYLFRREKGILQVA